MIYDSIIIGKGPAGITAGIYLKRYGFNPLIIAKDGGALENVKEIENYYGFKKISGEELLNSGYEQAKSFNIEILNEEVLDISYENSFIVKTNVSDYNCKTIIIASGASRNKYPLADKYEGVSYCATCDGFFYRKKKVAIIGNTNYMAHELAVLANMCKDIKVFTDGLPLEANITNDIEVITDKIIKINGDTHIKEIVTDSNIYEIDGLFIARGNASGFTLAKHLGIEIENNNIVVNNDMMTNINGIFACGDVVGGLLQVSKAVGEASICATSVSNFLKKNK